MRTIVGAVVAAGLLATAGLVSAADDCEPARCAAQAAFAQNCPACDDPAINHGRYVSCIAHQVKRLVDSGMVPQTCKGKVVRCAAKSTCGKPGFVTCRVPIDTCVINPTTGTGTCAANPALACTADIDCGATCHTKHSADQCPAGGVVGAGSCCASCATTP